ncbi:MAG: metal-dependent transcriptional regulator [Angelakisella sp.]|nr:metal-dependent transcriptional regulator [Angelakisella sp.]
MPDEFYTLSGYERLSPDELSPAMEDYLEMICRCTKRDGFARVNTLAKYLHVAPSSSSKMVQKLRQLGLVEALPYGVVRPTEKGRLAGEYLLYRHELLCKFFCRLNGTANELEQVEKIEHFISRITVQSIAQWLESHP